MIYLYWNKKYSSLDMWQLQSITKDTGWYADVLKRRHYNTYIVSVGDMFCCDSNSFEDAITRAENKLKTFLPDFKVISKEEAEKLILLI